ncbi:protein kinase [Pantoea agglomerans]|uniref:serine/threonine-protein kinase n=1 Tax=Enterobacter agglomerans TaxID=549 RepID=UPI003C7B7213
MLSDTAELRHFIKQIYPNFIISQVAKASGQRVVYFGSFSAKGETEPENCNKWGEIVVKISEATSRASISYIQKEIEVLKSLQTDKLPHLFFDEVITFDPVTEEKLNPVRIISIEERIKAVALSEIIIKYKDEEKVMDFLRQAIDALRLLWDHPQRLIHRDLKPDNILVKDDGKIVIIDLGIMRQQGVDGNTLSFLSFGPCTPYYASPEQAMNDKRNITFKADIFALGVICYEMLSGKNPFMVDGAEQYFEDILDRVCNFNPACLTAVGVSVSFSKIILKMMSKEPYKRYRTVDILLKDLEGVK